MLRRYSKTDYWGTFELFRDIETPNHVTGLTIRFVHFHRSWQIRQPAILSKLRSSVQGLFRLLSATTAKSISEVKPSNKRGAHHNRDFTLSRKQAFQRPIYMQKPDDFRHPAFQFAEREALEPTLSRNIIKLQITDNHILSKVQSKSKSFWISFAIPNIGCIFGCRISNAPNYEYQT